MVVFELLVISKKNIGAKYRLADTGSNKSALSNFAILEIYQHFCLCFFGNGDGGAICLPHRIGRP